MAKKMKVHCGKCSEDFEGKVSKNLSGFPKTKCIKCGHIELYPLGKIYKSIYWIIVIFVLIEVIFDLVTGDIKTLLSFSIAGTALIAVSAYGLLKDKEIKRDGNEKHKKLLKGLEYFIYGITVLLLVIILSGLIPALFSMLFG